MKSIERDDIHIISRHSNLAEEDVARALKENVYADQEGWKKFFRLFFIVLGVGFLVSGIVFFFAYNWADLHKFAKIGLVEGLLIATTSLVFVSKINATTRNVLLTGAAMLVGVLFSVYGQIYQTGANAYDFFLGWTVFVSLWVFVAGFPPLWLLYLLLINTTVILYSEQVSNWSIVLVCTLLLVLNAAVVMAAIFFPRYRKVAIVPNWFLYTVALAAVSFATIGIVAAIFDSYSAATPTLLFIAAVVYSLGVWHGLMTRNTFYISILPLSIIIIVSALLIDISQDAGMLLLVCLFIIGSVTLVIKNLLDLQRKWSHDN